MVLSNLRLLIAILLAFLAGKLILKLKLPSILGWLIAGMILGPYALSLVYNELLNAVWYQSIMHVLECAVGLMIGTELVWKTKKIWPFHYHAYSISKNIFIGISGVWSGFLFLRDSSVSCIPFWLYCSGNGPGARSIYVQVSG